MKIGWVLADLDRNTPSSGMRGYNIMEYLQSLGLVSELFRVDRDYDVVVFVKTLGDYYVRLAKSVKAITVFDIMDNHFITNPFSRTEHRIGCIQMSKVCDYVTTPSSYLANFAAYYTNHYVVIPDATENIYLKYVKRHIPKEEKILVWQGLPCNFMQIESIFPVLSQLAKKHKFTLHLITNTGDDIFGTIILPRIRRIRKEFNIVCKHWSLETRVADLLEGDIGVAPLIEDDWTRCKSNNKIASYMAMAIPTVGTPIPAYKETIKCGINGYLASAEEDWYNYLERLLIDHNLRKEIGNRGRETILAHFTLEKVGDRWLEFFREICEKGKGASKTRQNSF
jgi:glycosyltransferase involved in cell wall biosynthesis